MKPLVAGNWKMHLNRAEATALAGELVRGLPQPLEKADVALFPPYPYIADVLAAVADSDVEVGAQNMHEEDSGAFTGEVSGPMLLDVGATRVLVGHSERRHVFGESDETTNRKVQAALGHDIAPTLCVGETLEERETDRTEEVVERQLRAGLDGVAAERANTVTIAYEPVWAIGTGRTATPGQAGEVHAFLRDRLTDLWGDAGRTVRILYGGSVKPANTPELLATAEIGGVLVGGASLKADSFLAIIRAAA